MHFGTVGEKGESKWKSRLTNAEGLKAKYLNIELQRIKKYLYLGMASKLRH